MQMAYYIVMRPNLGFVQATSELPKIMKALLHIITRLTNSFENPGLKI